MLRFIGTYRKATKLAEGVIGRFFGGIAKKHVGRRIA